MDAVVYEFGPFRVDAKERTLTRDGKPVRLRKKVFDVLLVLLERAGTLVTREDLLKLAWPGSFVADNTLAQNIWLLRKAVGPLPAGGDAIETVPGLGYRFVVEMKCRGKRQDPAPRAGPVARLLWGRQRFGLFEGETLIGRLPEMDVFVDNPSVSRRHARISIAGGSATLEDLGSRNGTTLRGERVSGTALLADGDAITVGSVRLQFRFAGVAMTTRPDRR